MREGRGRAAILGGGRDLPRRSAVMVSLLEVDDNDGRIEAQGSEPQIYFSFISNLLQSDSRLPNPFIVLILIFFKKKNVSQAQYKVWVNYMVSWIEFIINASLQFDNSSINE